MNLSWLIVLTRQVLLSYNSFLLLLFFVFSCTATQTVKTDCKIVPVDPNGSSEMALFMRGLSKDCDTNKIRLKNNQLISFNIASDKILTSKMTKGHFIDSSYKSYAAQFIDQIKTINKATSLDKQLFFYNTMIKNCISCHQNRCPGPITKINKLYIN